MTKRQQREICANVCPSSPMVDSNYVLQGEPCNMKCGFFWYEAYKREHARAKRLNKKASELEPLRRLA